MNYTGYDDYNPAEAAALETVCFKIEKWGTRYAINRRMIDQLQGSARAYYEQHLDAMVVELVCSLPHRDGLPCRYPADWWEAVKERWLPGWAKDRWPVRYRVLVPRAYYPGLKLPREYGPEFVMFRPEPTPAGWTPGGRGHP